MGKYFKPKKYNFNTADAHFEHDERLHRLGIGGFSFDDGYCTLYVVETEYIDDFNFYVHEFSELTILSLIRRNTKKWRRMVKFKGFCKTDPAHLIAPCGYPNKATMFPDPSFRKVYKQLCYRLTKEELKMRG